MTLYKQVCLEEKKGRFAIKNASAPELWGHLLFTLYSKNVIKG